MDGKQHMRQSYDRKNREAGINFMVTRPAADAELACVGEKALL